MKKVILGLVVAAVGSICASWKSLATLKERAQLKAELEKLSTGKEISVADKDSICN